MLNRCFIFESKISSSMCLLSNIYTQTTDIFKWRKQLGINVIYLGS